MTVTDLRENEQIIERSFIEVFLAVVSDPVEITTRLRVGFSPVGVTFQVPDLQSDQVVLKIQLFRRLHVSSFVCQLLRLMRMTDAQETSTSNLHPHGYRQVCYSIGFALIRNKLSFKLFVNHSSAAKAILNWRGVMGTRR